MKVAVIGAGVIGVSTAYYLQQFGYQVTVYEASSKAGLITSYANAGLLTPSLCEPWNYPGVLLYLFKYIGKTYSPIHILWRELPGLLPWGLKFISNSNSLNYYKNFEHNYHLAHHSQLLMDELMQKAPIEFEYKKSGVLKLFRETSALDALQKNINKLSQWGVITQYLTPKETIAKEPALKTIQDKIIGSIYYPEDSLGDCHLFTKNLANYLEKSNVNFFYGAKVQLQVNKNGTCSIQNAHESELFDAIIITAGHESKNILANLDIKLPIQPLKGYSLTMPTMNWITKPQIPVIDSQLHIAITPFLEQLRITGGAEFAGLNTDISTKHINKLQQFLWDFYPENKSLTNNNEIIPWAGLRPTSVNGVPYISKTPYKNLFINTGHGHLGWTMALGSGKLAAELVSNQKTSLPIDCYSLAL